MASKPMGDDGVQQPLPAGAPPVAARGARVLLGPLLRLELAPAPPAGGAAAAASGSDGAATGRPPPQPPLAGRGTLERAYWDWRLTFDLRQVDTAFLAFSASQALLMVAHGGGGGDGGTRGAVALLLAACAAQLAGLLAPRGAYASARVPLIVAVRCVLSAAGWLSQRALVASLARGALVGAAGARVPALQAVLVATGVGRLALQPLGLQLPFALAAPLQLCDFGLARAGGAPAARVVSHAIEFGARRLAGPLHFLHDALDGLFHISTALLFPGAYDIPLACPAAGVEMLLLFLQLLVGCLLPLYWAYARELASKVRFVARWAAQSGLGVRSAELRARPGGAPSTDSGGGSGGSDADGSVSTRSGASWGSSTRSGDSRDEVELQQRGPFLLVELASIGNGPVIAPASHVGWLLLLCVVGWGMTSQLYVWSGGRPGAGVTAAAAAAAAAAGAGAGS
ncbi:hypothetical protein Rsub_08522 [Raphidocelis subcapitata]|uniref:Uncharacterized protein n=1 Tax=Raphidocelis subcapitata TaxID=307507 RepID=A0A2V0P6Q2_9CHLO|nr:hypothetical protein Rsub_08522 [Raphidocelis subcapitata]|eukprot:GBF95541.1 hypothetical protein Rsub_08522 [Raphidocelis subcapitata]